MMAFAIASRGWFDYAPVTEGLDGKLECDAQETRSVRYPTKKPKLLVSGENCDANIGERLGDQPKDEAEHQVWGSVACPC
jgi:hypothetical protein